MVPAASRQISADQRTQRHPRLQDTVDRHLKMACTGREGSLGEPAVDPYGRVVGDGAITLCDGKHSRKSLRAHGIVGIQIRDVASVRYCKCGISGRSIAAPDFAGRYLVKPVVTDIKDCQVVSIVVGCENHLQVHKSLVESARHCHMHGRVRFITGNQNADRR